MKKILTVVFAFIALVVSAQENYIVKTTTTDRKSATDSEEELFVRNNFPYYSICEWKAGQKFMLIIEDKYGFLPTLSAYANEREVSNSEMRYKVLDFWGFEEKETTSYVGTGYSTRFVFEADSAKYYREEKNKRIADICGGNPRALIYNLVYLGDVDIARELLVGKTLYTKVTKAWVDDANGASGSHEVGIPKNLEVTVTAVGAGTRECPVKLIFEDRNGNSYFRNIMFSKTNSGLLATDLVGAHLEKYFPNVFSFTDKEIKTNEDIRAKYVGRAVYPKHTVEARMVDGSSQALLRFTPLVVGDMTPAPSGTLATLKITDRSGTVYTVEVDLKYDIFIRNENYIDDMFGYGDLRKQHPNISEDNWILLSKGEVKTGMTKDECRLSLGSPIQIVANAYSRYETWFYQGRVLEFDGNQLSHIK